MKRKVVFILATAGIGLFLAGTICAQKEGRKVQEDKSNKTTNVDSGPKKDGSKTKGPKDGRGNDPPVKPPPPPPQSPEAKQLSACKGRLDNFLFDEAITACSAAIKINDTYAEAYYTRAIVFTNRMNVEAAMADYEMAVEHDPDYWQAYNNMGTLYLDKLDIDKALENYTRGISVRPSDDTVRKAAEKDASKYQPADTPLMYVNRGKVYRLNRENAAAIADFNKAIEFNPNDDKAYLNRGLAFQAEKNYEAAIRDCNKAGELDPANIEAGKCMSAATVAKESIEARIADMSKGIEADPDIADGYFNRGKVYLEANKYDDAITDYNKTVELGPRPAILKFAYLNRGIAYSAKTEYDKALVDLDRALALDPTFLDAYLQRAAAFAGKGEYDAAISGYTKALGLKPSFGDAYLKRGLARIEKGKLEPATQDAEYAEAIRDLTRYIEYNPGQPFTYLYRASVYDRLKQKDRADADRKSAKEKWR